MLFGGKMIPAFFFAVGFLVSGHKKKFCFFNALRSLHSLLPEKNRSESEQSECSAGLLIPFFQRSKMLFGGKMIPAFFFAIAFADSVANL